MKTSTQIAVYCRLFAAVTMIFTFSNVYASDPLPFKNAMPDTGKPQPTQQKFKLSSYIVTYFSQSLDKNIDVTSGKRFANDSGVVNNTFGFQYIRVQGNYELNDRVDASILVNLKELKAADFQKIIELAFIRYKFFKEGYLNLQMGQFRPYTLVEDLYGFQLHKSYIWSNQYTAMAASNWTSFQMGAALTGSLKKLKVPVNYYVTLWNGNGRTASPYNSDNDNAKNIAFRGEYEYPKVGMIGASIASSKYLGKSARMYSADFRGKFNLNKKLELECEASYADATDISLLNTVAKTIPAALTLDFGKYEMHGFYILPLLRYKILSPALHSAEFSFRYEDWEQNMASGTMLNGTATNGSVKNPKHTYTPMICFNLADKYAARVELIGVFNEYSHDLPAIKGKENAYCNSSQAILQLQFLF